MNISNWGIGKIMQLPDWCFGRRFLIALEAYDSGAGVVFDISEVALPDRAVLWNVVFVWDHSSHLGNYCKLTLGDQLPVTIAQQNEQVPLLPGLGRQGADPREIYPVDTTGQFSIPLRMSIAAQGRRPVLGVNNVDLTAMTVQVYLTFSSIPMEVPDWLVSV